MYINKIYDAMPEIRRIWNFIYLNSEILIKKKLRWRDIQMTMYYQKKKKRIFQYLYLNTFLSSTY